MSTLSLPNRYLIDFSVPALPHFECDVLVIGSGIAGLSAALRASKLGTVAVVTKAARHESNTFYAQGGIAAALNPEDTRESHVQDTLVSGKGLCDEVVVKLTVDEGVERVREMVDWGTKFDRKPDGALAFTAEGGHSANRILHCFGDHTGRELERSMLQQCEDDPNIVFYEDTYVIDLLTENGRCFGAIARDPDGRTVAYIARAVVLAAGGGGQLFRETTNPNITTGDGFALAFRAGCVLRDMEFVQFHPTTVYIAGAERMLITEAARGEGALLLNCNGGRFMPGYHESAELAPRDVVSASIIREMKKTEHVCVYLDMTHMNVDRVKLRFPNILQVCTAFGLDPAKDWIPVRPSVHYMIGGVEIDHDGRTRVSGLYAAGEVTSSGLHGANRLGSNSLLEGLVFGHRAARAIESDWAALPAVRSRLAASGQKPPNAHLDERDMINSIKSDMWRKVGIERNADGLKRASADFAFWRAYVLAARFPDARGWTLQNMLTVGSAIAQCALAREESRGAHIRTDFPETNDEKWKRHSTIERAS